MLIQVAGGNYKLLFMNKKLMNAEGLLYELVLVNLTFI